ncbi:MAG TPA: hypothetical protein VM118_13430, partial [Acidobacteriota bacterium]|nr:hypothetical protein [Acidobacteriota bacterium]
MSRFRKIVLFTLALAVIIVAGAILLITRTPILTDRAVGYLNTSLARTTTLQISVGRVTGDWINRLVVHDVVVTESRPDAVDTLLQIAEVAFEYRLTELIQLVPVVRRIAIDRPRIRLPDGSLVEWQRRMVRGVADAPPRDTLADFIVEAVSISDGSVERAAGDEIVADQILVNLVIQRLGGEWRIGLLPSVAQTVSWGTVSAEGQLVTRENTWSADSV